MKKLLQHLVSSRPVTWLFVNVIPFIDRPLLRLSRGYLSVSVGQPVVLLATRGARTGQIRETPLIYFRDGDAIVLIASNGGSMRHPAWYHNLRVHPDVTATFAGTRERFRAEQVTGPERERLWQAAREHYLGFGKYQTRAGDRQIPVVRLRPLSGG